MSSRNALRGRMMFGILKTAMKQTFILKKNQPVNSEGREAAAPEVRDSTSETGQKSPF